MTWDEIVKQGYDQFLRHHEDLEYVVRCKDCKHFAGEGMYCANNFIPQFEHFYCYYGERKERSEDEQIH